MSPSESFYLNLAVSLGVHDMLSKLNPGHVAVKWPNDIMINNKKTCGILIENTISSGVVAKSIVGIGLNVNQQHFAVNSATSLRKETGKSYDLNQLLASMLHAVEIRYLQTKTEPPRLRADYLGCMFRRHQQHTFRTGDRIFEGMIEGIDSTGRLQIKTDGELLAFGLKEIAYLD